MTLPRGAENAGPAAAAASALAHRVSQSSLAPLTCSQVLTTEIPPSQARNVQGNSTDLLLRNHLDLPKRITRDRFSEDCQKEVASDSLGSGLGGGGCGLLSQGFIPKESKEGNKEAKYKSSRLVSLPLSPCAFISEMMPQGPT